MQNGYSNERRTHETFGLWIISIYYKLNETQKHGTHFPGEMTKYVILFCWFFFQGYLIYIEYLACIWKHKWKMKMSKQTKIRKQLFDKN